MTDITTFETYGITAERLLGVEPFACTTDQLRFLHDLMERHEMTEEQVITRFGGKNRQGWQILDSFATWNTQVQHEENQSRLTTDGQYDYLMAFRTQAVEQGKTSIVRQIDSALENIGASFGDYSRVIANLQRVFPLVRESAGEKAADQLATDLDNPLGEEEAF